MKRIKILFLFVILIIVILPIIFFNNEENAVSEIDNRPLAEKPFEIGLIDDDLNKKVFPNLENYVKDRIGFRDNMIEYYTLLNDKLFGKMVHPLYSYGKDGYVFGAGVTVNEFYNEYHDAFVNFVSELQNYTESRDVPFLLVFNPAKPAIYQDKIRSGINYNRKWVDHLFEKLNKLDINFLDNTTTLIKAKNNGENVFNKKYDANHWNYIGAYWGVNEILSTMSKVNENIKPNDLNDFNLEYETKLSLPTSKFNINEEVPLISLKSKICDLTDYYKNELLLDEKFRHFKYTLNKSKQEENSPKVLVFQGSYMNIFGKVFLENSLGEYISVHDYKNILNLPYYFNIFDPDYVVFEVAEYTLKNNFFNFEEMQNVKFNKKFDSIKSENEYFVDEILNMDDLSIETGSQLTKIRWNNNSNAEYGWIFLDKEYDMIKDDDGLYFLSIPTNIFEKYKSNLYLATYNDDEKVIKYYRFK